MYGLYGCCDFMQANTFHLLHLIYMIASKDKQMLLHQSRSGIRQRTMVTSCESKNKMLP